MGRKFTIFSDHHALQWLKTIKNPSGRLFRWSLRLSSYEYEVRYIKGKLQYEADLLSRNPFCGFLDATLIKTHQTFPSRKSNLTIDRNGLHTVSRKGVTKIIIPKPLIQQLLQTVHTQYNHPGISQMSRLISTQYYWQGMSKDIKQKVKTCPTCQLTKRPLGPTYGELSQPPETKEPFDLLSLDTIAGFAKYGNTKIYLHVVVDHFSRYAWTFPSKSTSIITYQQVLKRVLQDGSPKRLLTDRAPAFTSPKFRSFLLNRNIHPLLTTSNNPQANGLCERLNATLTGKLRLLHLENPKIAWTKLVKRVTIIYNKTPHSTTGFPPIYLMFGILPPEISDHSTPYPDIDKARKIAHTRTQNKHLQDKNIYDQRHKQPHFEVGDLVLVKLYHHPNTGKLAPYFTGPHTILEIISPNVVHIDRPNQPLQRDNDTIHVNKLKLYTETIRYISPPAVSTYHIKHEPDSTFPFKHLTPKLFPADPSRFKPTSSEPFRHLDPAIFATRRFAPLLPDVKNCKPDNHFNHITPLPKDIKQCEIKRPTMNKGSSVLDLFMVSPALLELVLDLSIESLPYSDHLPLLLKLNGSDNTKAKSLPLEHIPVQKFTWSINKASTYELCLENLNALQLPEDASIDLCADTLTSRIQTSMMRAGMLTKGRADSSRSKPWFDGECYTAKTYMKKNLKLYLTLNTPIYKDLFITSKRKYLSLLKYKKNKYSDSVQAALSNVRDSAEFWKIIASFKKRNSTKGNIDISECESFYQGLLSPPQRIVADIPTLLIPIDSELDAEISPLEIAREIASLKNNKAAGYDSIPNEAIKALPENGLILLSNLFNKILTKSQVPSQWSKTIIQPILKNGDPNAPSNYRGIALISNLSKLFTSILKNRLSNWIENRKLIAENQAGFRRGYSCQDHIFTLTSLIQMTLNRKRRKLYAFFVDLKKAFDTVPHLLLWRKLALVGLSGRFIKLIQNYYAQMMAAVRWNGSFTEFIKIQSGVLQGEPLSPYLFIIFINDLVATLDDSDLPVFRNGGRLARSDVWFWGQQPLTVSSKYTYLGYPLTTKNTTAYVAQHFKSKALVATNAVWRILSKSRTKSFGAVMKLLDSIVLSTLLYSAPMWATNQIVVVNQIQDIFLRRFLDLPKYTPGYILRTETGRMSLELNITKLILKFWIRILKMDRTRLPYVCLSQLWKVSIVGKAGNNFIHNLNSIIDSRGFSFLKNCEDYMVVRGEIPRIIQTTVDQLLQFDRAKIQGSTHFIHYQFLSSSFMTEGYLLTNLPLKIKRFIARQRILWLLFHEDITGFWNSDPLNCYFCNVGIQDNLVHYLFHCPFLHEKRLEIREISELAHYNEQHVYKIFNALLLDKAFVYKYFKFFKAIDKMREEVLNSTDNG
ncbi:hypothetical protein LAZ67_15002500 [Cordylochernes scorpioides]|uniref:RNA-directed DNA polymerase n=1 Tax=Cordylochernes scorpioides TaxID=51811 RepID=A0ABY6L9K9_9ARAC|nr:hypothetical protein LAZ67_15002500 [Cordylochernes scorpioides]